MKRILFIAVCNIAKRNGVGLATLAYYNSLCQLYPGIVDLMMPESACTGSYSKAIGVPSRHIIQAMFSGSLHRYKTFLRQYLSSKADLYGICVINGGFYAGDMMNMIHDFGLKIVVIHHNFEREYQMDNKSSIALWGHSPYFVIQNERKAYCKADVNCFLTQEDESSFLRYYGKGPASNNVLGVFEPYDSTWPIVDEKSSYLLVITGSLNSVQTMSGIVDIHKNYYDIIQELCPQWNLVIAGRNPHHEVYDFQRENPEHIKVIPNPEIMDMVTNPASIFLCPTNVGGGLKLRVMDGLRQGLPVLVHKVSARGYNSFFGKPFFQIYQDRASFRDGLKNLLEYCQSGLNKKEIQQTYFNEFGFQRGCEKMSQVINSLCE